jgi:polyhydroxyalkanoate synthesis regulator phasin
MRDTAMDAWAKSMIDMVNSEEYSRASAAFLDNYLTASEPFRRTVAKVMEQVLSGLNMPSRQDVTNLAERLTNIEMRLDDLDAKLDGFSAKPAPRRAKE